MDEILTKLKKKRDEIWDDADAAPAGYPSNKKLWKKYWILETVIEALED